LLYLVAPTTAVAGTLLFGDPFTPATLVGLVLGAGAIALVIAPARRRPERIGGESRDTPGSVRETTARREKLRL